MFDVITIGSSARDVILESDQFIALASKKFKTGFGECVSLGSKIELDKIIHTTGGGATNAGATFGQLGFKVAVITKVGDDMPGKEILEDLRRYKVNTNHVRIVKKGETAYSTLLTMKDGERTVLVYRGVCKQFTDRDIDWDAIKNTKWIYLTSLGGNIALSKKIIDQAKKAGAKVFWNPGSKELNEGISIILPLLSKVDIFDVNKEEAELLTKQKSIKDQFKTLASGETIRLITDGIKGTHAFQNDILTHAGTTAVKAISRTGAGDAFGSGFLAGLLKTKHLKQALAIGTINAESVIQKFGPKHGILTAWPSSLKIKKIKIT
jgi:sugar/nucleoside kinase (ribokinase family)